MQLKKRLFLNLFPADVLRKLLLIDVFLALLSLIATVFIHQYETRLEQALWILSTNEESSLPTWYASIKLLGCALFIYLIYRQKSREEDRFTLHWKMLFGIMLYISIDEIATFRENIAIVLYPVINGTGIFAHNWVLIVLPIVFVTAIFYINFLVKLPAKTRRLFVASGVLFVGGAVGFEMATAFLKSLHDYDTSQWGTQEIMTHLALTTVEELLEMVAISIFLYAILSYIRENRILDSFQMKLTGGRDAVRSENIGP